VTKRGWVLFAAMSVIWGVPYLFIKIAVDHGIPPVTLAWVLIAMAALLLLALAYRAGTLPSLRGSWRWLALYGVVEISIPFPMIGFGEERVASSLAAIVISSVPLVGAVLAMRFDHSERPTPVRAFGLLLGFGGVIALVGIDVAGNGAELLGTGAIFVAAVGYAIGPMVIKHRLGALDPRATMGASLAIAAVVLAPAAALDHPDRVPSAGAIGAVLVLGLVCTALAFVIFSRLIVEVGSGRATVITYVNPVIALAVGLAVLGERPGAGAILGLILILSGSWMATRGRVTALEGGEVPGPAAAGAPAASGDLDENDRVDHERDREADRPPVEVAFDQRATAKRPRPGAYSECARET